MLLLVTNNLVLWAFYSMVYIATALSPAKASWVKVAWLFTFICAMIHIIALAGCLIFFLFKRHDKLSGHALEFSFGLMIFLNLIILFGFTAWLY